MFDRKAPNVCSEKPLVYVAESVLVTSSSLLQGVRDMDSAHEAILYWAGRTFSSFWIVTTCIAPHARTSWGSFATSASSNANVIKHLSAYGLELLGQVHSHPDTLVDHSRGDESGAFMPYENFLSIVVPYYGTRGIVPFGMCGVHRFEDGRFVRLSNNQIDKSLLVLPERIDLRSDE